MIIKLDEAETREAELLASRLEQQPASIPEIARMHVLLCSVIRTLRRTGYVRNAPPVARQMARLPRGL